MRTLAGVSSSDHVTVSIQAEITPADVSTTHVFSHDRLIRVSPIKWEIPFGGGLGKPSSYNITISDSLDNLKSYLPDLVQATVNLKITVNDTVFVPHVGRVRDITRSGRDPQTVVLRIYDRFLDDDPLFPKEALVDSWSTVHPEDIDKAYPLYYGLHHRPFYFTAVTSDVSILLGPRNVSSENHVSSLFFISDRDVIADPALSTNILLNKTWQQEDSLNVATGGHPFEIIDAGPGDTRFWRWGDAFINRDLSAAASDGVLTSRTGGVVIADAQLDDLGAGERHFLTVPAEKLISQTILRATHIAFSATVSNHIVNSGYAGSLFISSGTKHVFQSWISNSPSTNPIVGSFDISDEVNSYSANQFFDGDRQGGFHARFSGTNNGRATIVASVMYGAQLAANAFNAFTIYAPPVNSADIAVSTNPIGILDDIFSNHLGILYQQAQSSLAQTSLDDYKFNALFYQRQPITSIIEDFAKFTATYIWVADSGYVSFRTYAESAIATGSLDLVLASSDYFSLDLVENPLGTSVFEGVGASKLSVEYGYDFSKASYNNALRAFPANTALCNSADAAGVTRERVVRTQYVLDTDTASLALGNLVRFNTQGKEYARLKLPAQFFTLELADVVKIQHPMIVGSEGLYQVTKVQHDYMKGEAEVTATRLLSLNP